MNERRCAAAKTLIKSQGHKRKSSWILLADKQSLGAICIDCGKAVTIDKSGNIDGEAVQFSCARYFAAKGT